MSAKILIKTNKAGTIDRICSAQLTSIRQKWDFRSQNVAFMNHPNLENLAPSQSMTPEFTPTVCAIIRRNGVDESEHLGAILAMHRSVKPMRAMSQVLK